MPKIEAVICDFDGVILDSAQKGQERIIQIVREAGYEIPRNINQRLRKNWGAYGPRLIKICFGLSTLTSQSLYKRWEELDVLYPVPLVDGVKDALTRLTYFKKLKLGILTSRHEKSLLTILHMYNLVHFFSYIQAVDTLPFVKPDPRVFDNMLLHFSIANITENRCLYAGDTPIDYECASARGMPNVSVLTGLFDKEAFLAIGQKEENIIHSIFDLPAWLSKQEL